MRLPPLLELGPELGGGRPDLLPALRGRVEVALGDRGLLLPAQEVYALLHFGKPLRTRARARPKARARLVHRVDRLVRQLPRGQIPRRQLHRRRKRGRRELRGVELLVSRGDALENLYRVGDRGLVDLDGLEPPLKRRVLLDGLVVLLERGRADALQLAARKGRLEYVRRVHGALRAARADHCVQLVEKEYYVARAPRLVDYALQALLELAAVLRARDEPRHVERHDPLGLHALRHLAAMDREGKALDDRSLADACLAHQNRVVLGAAGKYLHYAPQLLRPADDRVELAMPGEVREVAPERVHRRRLASLAALRLPGALRVLPVAFRRSIPAFLPSGGSVRAALAARRDELLDRDARVEEQLRRRVVSLAQHGRNKVGRVDRVALAGLDAGHLDDLASARRERQRPPLKNSWRASLHHLAERLRQVLRRKPERAEPGDCLALRYREYRKEDVLAAYVVVAELARAVGGRAKRIGRVLRERH